MNRGPLLRFTMRNTKDDRFIDVFTSFDGAKARFPLMTKRSGKPGPTVFLTGVVHGEEAVGLEVIHRVFEEVELKRGTLVAIPVANMAGFLLGMRTMPYGEMADWSNLNRIFPGDAAGSPAERIAAAVYKTITDAKPDLVIDLHADSHNSLPFILLDRFTEKPDAKLMKATEEFAEDFGVTVCDDDDQKSYVQGGGAATLSGCLFNRARIPAFTVELGGPMLINEQFVRIGVTGVRNVLAGLKMLEDDWGSVQDPSKIRPGFRMRTLTIPAGEASGKIRYRVNIGDRIEKGQPLAIITDVFGKKLEEVLSPANGFMISTGYQAISFPGMTLAILAVKEK